MLENFLLEFAAPAQYYLALGDILQVSGSMVGGLPAQGMAAILSQLEVADSPIALPDPRPLTHPVLFRGLFLSRQ